VGCLHYSGVFWNLVEKGAFMLSNFNFDNMYDILLDEKNRIAIPKKDRSILKNSSSGEIVIFLRNNGCLNICPYSVWEKIADKVQKNEKNMQIRKKILHMKHKTKIDSQGRISVPKTLRILANILTREMTLIGIGDKFELWSSDALAEDLSKSSSDDYIDGV